MVFNRLTDTNQYTGTHKLRFDENGVGKGSEGRDQTSKTSSLDKVVERSAVPFKKPNAVFSFENLGIYILISASPSKRLDIHKSQESIAKTQKVMSNMSIGSKKASNSKTSIIKPVSSSVFFIN